MKNKIQLPGHCSNEGQHIRCMHLDQRGDPIKEELDSSQEMNESFWLKCQPKGACTGSWKRRWPTSLNTEKCSSHHYDSDDDSNVFHEHLVLDCTSLHYLLRD